MLIECPECKSQISDKASTCPSCGHPLTVRASVGAPVEQSYKPILPPRQLRPFGLLVGLGLIALGLFLALSWIPDHTPPAVSMQRGIEGVLLDAIQTQGSSYLRPDSVPIAKTLAWFLVLAGVINIVVGGTKRAGRLGFCKKCNMQVVAMRRGFRYLCERCDSVVK